MKLIPTLLLLTTFFTAHAQDTVQVLFNKQVVFEKVMVPDTLVVYVDRPEEPLPTPMQRIQAEDANDSQGVVIGDGVVGFIEPGDWIRYNIVTTGNFLRIRYSFATAPAGRKLQVRTGSITGEVIAEWEQQSTGSWEIFSEAVIPVSASGTRDLFFTFTGTPGFVLNIDWFEFFNKEPEHPEQPEPPVQGKIYRVSPNGTGDCVNSPCTFERVAQIANAPATVIAQEGTYTITNYLTWPAVSIKGSGVGKTIIRIHSDKFRAIKDNLFQTRSQNMAVFNMRTTGENPVSFSDFSVDGQKPTGSHQESTRCMAAVFNIEGRSNVTFRNIEINDVGHWAIWLKDTKNVKILNVEMSNASRGRPASGPHTITWGTGMIMYEGKTEDFEVAYSRFEQDYGGPAIQAYGTGGTWNMSSYNQGKHCQLIRAKIHNNYFTSHENATWPVNGQYAASISMEAYKCKCSYSEFYNNDLDGNLSIVEKIFDDGKFPFKPEGGNYFTWKIFNNDFNSRRRSSGKQYGLELDASDCIVENNTFEVGRYGGIVDFGGGVTYGNNRIRNNLFYKAQPDGASVITMTSAWTNSVFEYNTFALNGQKTVLSFASNSSHSGNNSSNILFTKNIVTGGTNRVAGKGNHNVSGLRIIDNILHNATAIGSGINAEMTGNRSIDPQLNNDYKSPTGYGIQ